MSEESARPKPDDEESANGRLTVNLNVDGDVKNSIIIGQLNLLINGSVHERQMAREYHRLTRLSVLNAMHAWVEGFLGHGLQALVAIEYQNAFKVQTRYVRDRSLSHSTAMRPWHVDGQALSPGTTIRQLFEEHAGLLLLSGSAGVGKTSQLAELASNLVDEAQQALADDNVTRIPLFLDIATRNLPAAGETSRADRLEDWIVAEASARYNAGAEKIRSWLETGQLVLLLDDLSSLDESERETFVREINALRKVRGSNQIVITTRTEDVDRLDAHFSLPAVRLEPESADAGREALTALLPLSEPVLHFYDSNPDAQALLRLPFFLSAALLGMAPSRSPDQGDAALETGASAVDQVLSRYVTTMLETMIHEKTFPAPEARYWAASLADLLTANNQKFALWWADPRWISQPRRRWMATKGSTLIGAGLNSVLWSTPVFLLAGWKVAAVAAVWSASTDSGRKDSYTDPEETLSRVAWSRRQVRWAPHVFLTSPYRWAILAGMTVVLITLVVLPRWFATATSDIGPVYNLLDFVVGHWWLTAAAVLLTLPLLLFVAVDDPEPIGEYLDLGEPSAAGPSSWLTIIVKHAFAAVIIGTLLGSVFGAGFAAVNWLYGQDSFQVSIYQQSSSTIGNIQRAIGRFVSRELNSAPFGEAFTSPVWPLMVGATFAIAMGLLYVFEVVASIGGPLLVQLADRQRIPTAYQDLLGFLTRVTIMRKTAGRWEFVHAALQDRLAAEWQSLRKTPPADIAPPKSLPSGG